MGIGRSSRDQSLALSGADIFGMTSSIQFAPRTATRTPDLLSAVTRQAAGLGTAVVATVHPGAAVAAVASAASAVAVDRIDSATRSSLPSAPPLPVTAPVSAPEVLGQGGSGSGSAVTAVQRRLTAIGYGVQTTGRFGPTTEGVVKRFQAENGVAQTGKVGPTTLAALGAAEFAAVVAGRLSFGRGDDGDGVRRAQQALTAAGFGVAATGIFGPTTEGVVKQLQQARGLPVTGRIDVATMAAMSKTTSSKTPRIDQNALPHERNWAFCGVASANMVLGSEGKPVDLSTSGLNSAAAAMYLAGDGTSGSHMAQWLTDKGVASQFTMTATIDDITKSLQQGRSVPLGVDSFGGRVTGMDANSARYPSLAVGDDYDHTFGKSGHWVVVTGFEGPASAPTKFTVNDPDTGATVSLTRAQLERHSASGAGAWAVLPR